MKRPAGPGVLLMRPAAAVDLPPILEAGMELVDGEEIEGPGEDVDGEEIEGPGDMEESNAGGDPEEPPAGPGCSKCRWSLRGCRRCNPGRFGDT